MGGKYHQCGDSMETTGLIRIRNDEVVASECIKVVLALAAGPYWQRSLLISTNGEFVIYEL